jgi:autoaggregation protein RapA/B/C
MISFNSLMVGALIASFAACGASATTVTASFIRNVETFPSMAVDPSTGMFYDSDGHTVQVFSGAAAFQAGTPSSSFDLGTYGIAGPYIAARDGMLYGRTWGPTLDGMHTPIGTTLGTWNASTGAFGTLSASIPNISGQNFKGTFVWGGYSGPNVLQDATGMYVLGKIDALHWQVSKLNADLSIASSKTFATGDPFYYAFAINGTIFAGVSGDGFGRVTQEFNFATGQLTSTDFTFSGSVTPNIYDTLYDPTADALYLPMNGLLFEVSNASVAFNVAVPEPSTWAMLLIGFAGTGFAIYRRRNGALRLA